MLIYEKDEEFSFCVDCEISKKKLQMLTGYSFHWHLFRRHFRMLPDCPTKNERKKLILTMRYFVNDSKCQQIISSTFTNFLVVFALKNMMLIKRRRKKTCICQIKKMRK
jgi:hypothetical protein